MKWSFMRRTVLVLAALLSSLGAGFAQGYKEVPGWVKRSVIIASDTLFDEMKTIDDLFSKPKETTSVVAKVGGSEMTLFHEIASEGVVLMKVDVTFRLSKVGDAGTCFVSRVRCEIPMTFQSVAATCYSPYDDPGGYGQCMGLLGRFWPLMYD